MASPLPRPDLYVVARFLDVLWDPEARFGKEYTRGRLQAATRLNYDIFCKYLDSLLEKGLVAEKDGLGGRPVYVLTVAGRDAHERIVDWARRFVEGRL